MNTLNINLSHPVQIHTLWSKSSYSATKFLQPANLTTYTIWFLFNLHVEPTPHSLLALLLDHLYLCHYKSFRYASPYLWNQLPSFRQPHSVHSPPGSPHPVRISPHHSHHLHSHHLCVPWLFVPDLKTHLFHKSFPPSSFWFPFTACTEFGSHQTRLGILACFCLFLYFYRAMHFSAKRGIVIACRLSVCLSVCL